MVRTSSPGGTLVGTTLALGPLVRLCTARKSDAPSTDGSCSRFPHGHNVLGEVTSTSHPRTVQGKPVARRGRKARDLANCETAQLPGDGCRLLIRSNNVKANLARFTMALAVLASVAMVLGAGVRWN